MQQQTKQSRIATETYKKTLEMASHTGMSLRGAAALIRRQKQEKKRASR